MRRKPIEEPKFMGCLNCSPMPTVKQDKYETQYIGFDYGLCNIYLYEKGNDEPVEIHYLGDIIKKDETTFAEIEKVFAIEIDIYDYIEVDFTSALRGEEYEYNKEDSEWYLTGQNQGWA